MMSMVVPRMDKVVPLIELRGELSEATPRKLSVGLDSRRRYRVNPLVGVGDGFWRWAFFTQSEPSICH